MFRTLVLLSALSFFKSCALFKPTVHDHMSKRMKTFTYSESISKLKPKVKVAIEKQNTFSGAKMIILTTTQEAAGQSNFDAQTKAKEAMEDGFTFENRLYKAKEFSIDFADLFASDTSGRLKSKLDDVIRTGDIHLIKDTPEEFIYVKGGKVITVRKVSENKTLIDTCILNGYERGSLNLGFDVADFATNGFNLLNALRLSSGPVVLEDSMDYCQRDRAMELALFYELAPKQAEKWEKEAQKALEK